MYFHLVRMFETEVAIPARVGAVWNCHRAKFASQYANEVGQNVKETKFRNLLTLQTRIAILKQDFNYDWGCRKIPLIIKNLWLPEVIIVLEQQAKPDS